mgnify:FL=1
MWRSMKGLLTLAGSGLGLALGFIDCSNEQNCEAEAVLKGRAGYSRRIGIGSDSMKFFIGLFGVIGSVLGG